MKGLQEEGRVIEAVIGVIHEIDMNKISAMLAFFVLYLFGGRGAGVKGMTVIFRSSSGE